MVNLALVGSGRWGTNYLETINEISECKLVYVCSPNIESKNISSKFVKVKNYKELKHKKKLDGVIIATPASTHYEIASFFIKNDINILLEKPLVTSYIQAKKLKKIISKSKSKVFPGHIYNYNPGILLTKKFASLIGNIVEIQCKSYSNGPIRQDVSDLWDRAYHDIYISQLLSGSSPISVSCKVKNKITNLVLNYPGNIKSKIKVSSYHKNKVRLFTIRGKKGTIIFDDVKKHIYIKNNSGRIIKNERIGGNPLKNEIMKFIKILKKNKVSNFDDIFEIINIINYAEKSKKSFGEKIHINEN